MNDRQHPARLLHLAVSPEANLTLRRAFDTEGVAAEIRLVQTRADLEAALEDGDFDLVLAGGPLSDLGVAAAVEKCRRSLANATYICVPGFSPNGRLEAAPAGQPASPPDDPLCGLLRAVGRAMQEFCEQQAKHQGAEQLHRRTELFWQITQNVDDAIAVVDVLGRPIFTNPAYQHLHGKAPAAGAELFSEVHPADRERVRAEFQTMIATGQGARIEYRCVQKDGGVRYVESQRSVIRDSSGTITHAVVVSRDVTDREEAARKIREQAALLDQASDAIYVRGLDQRITYWNRGAERLYGWTSAEVLGRPAPEVFPSQKESTAEDPWKTLLVSTETISEMQHVTRDGREVTVASRHTLLRDAAGQAIAILTIDTDISERKQLEAQFLRAQRLENIGSLAGGIAHDLNNILAPVLIVAEMLSLDFPEGPTRQMLDTVKESAHRGSELVAQILRFARGIKGESGLIQIPHVIKDLEVITRNSFPRSIVIETSVSSDLPPVSGDATQIHQVLLNLCVNARDAMPDGGKLSVQASPVMLEEKKLAGRDQPVSGRHVLLSVSDTGFGIPAALREKIFQPFFTTKAQGRGTGLGLSTVAKIVRDHGGDVEVASEPGKGSTFRVYLPAAAETTRPAREDAPGLSPVGRGEHVLLVDDERAVLEMTRAMLVANQYRVTTAKDGAEALMAFQQQPGAVDVIVTDSMMPTMDGPSFIRIVKQLAPRTRVISVSATPPETATVGSPGIDVHVRKPYTAGELLRTLRRVLESSA